MSIFIPNENIEKNQSFGQVVNKALKEYIEPEMKRMGLKDFRSAGVEILLNHAHKVYFDNDVLIKIEFKDKKLNLNNVGKLAGLDLKEIKDIEWYDQKLNKNSAKILIVHFNKD